MSHTDPPTERMHDDDAEVALLSACLWSKNARIASKRIVLPADFYSPHHEAIYDAMLRLDRTGKNVDPVTVRAALDSAARGADGLMVAVTTATAIPESVGDYAAIVRRWALKRRMAAAGRWISQRAMAPDIAPDRLAAEAVTRMTAIRDHGLGDVVALTLSELMDVPDEGHRWVIPGLLEAGDRLILTGSEGAGKSVLSRQFAVMASAGVHPFTNAVIPPIRAMVVDCENKPAQVRRGMVPLVLWLRNHSVGQEDPTERVLVDTPGRIDITRDRDLARIHQAIDAWRPDLVIMGPIYRMAARALQTDDEAAPFLAALDTITDRGCAVILEAHAGHGKDGVGKAQERSMRPRGSSALMGWPEFGLGLRGLGGGLADLEPWRGGREARDWPARLRRAPGHRWVETSPDDRDSDFHDEEPAREATLL